MKKIKKIIKINKRNIPLYCPNSINFQWNMHPKIFLKINKNSFAICPYCNTKFVLKI